MDRKSNLLKMMFGTMSVALLFAAVAMFVSVYLPDSGESVPVGTARLADEAKPFDVPADPLSPAGTMRLISSPKPPRPMWAAGLTS